MTFGKPFEPGREKTGGRQKGTRNKISEAFLKDLHTEWERSGPAVLKILAVENPGVFAGLVAKVLPTAFDDEYPTRITIVTGVPRVGDPSPPPGILIGRRRFRLPFRACLSQMIQTLTIANSRRVILRHRGLSLSAELPLIGTAVTWGHVERLPHPPTPLAAQPLDKKAASPGGLLAF